MKPPYDITDNILKLTSFISEKIGEVKAAHLMKPRTELRKRNRIRTIQSSLEIEGNTLSEEQITDLLNDKRVIAPQKDILEVKNAIEVYDRMDEFYPYDMKSICKAHGILMEGLIDNAGKLRNSSVGVIKGSVVAHIAPPSGMVHSLVQSLLAYLKHNEDLILIKSCVFHYEFEFIHPFMDGNGRMGRFWQSLILREYSPIFEYLPIESLIKERQMEYYSVLGKCDREGKSTLFVEFMLDIIDTSLADMLSSQRIKLNQGDRISIFRTFIGEGFFTRKDYLKHFKDISTATASRDLKKAVELNVVEISGDKRNAKYRYLLI